ncbi:MAG: radical SAM protein, partial [Planctomycetota bacterium]
VSRRAHLHPCKSSILRQGLVMAPKLFAVPLLNQWLLYAPLHGVSALLNRSALDHLISGDGDLSAELSGLRRELAEEVPIPQPKTGEIAPDFLGFITTRACNIGCLYCDFGGPTAKRVEIDPLIVVSAIDWMANQLVAAGRQLFKVHLFGGEPFQAPEMVDLIVHRTRLVCAKYHLTPWFEASTNGVFNESRSRFVADYINTVVLSFDGPRRFHDHNRPGFNGQPTFDVVYRTAKYLSRSSTELCLRCCITQDSVHHMSEITEWMIEEFNPSAITHEPLTENELTRGAHLAPPDPYDFAINWWRSHRIASQHGIKLVYSATENDKPRLSSCPVGSDTVIVSPDGRVSACYLLPMDWQQHGMNMDMGWFHQNGNIQFDTESIHEIRNLIIDKPRCEKCLCQWDCAGGCHVSQTHRNCDTSYNAFCYQTRLVTSFLLTERLGFAELVEELLTNREALRRIAEYPWDGLELQGVVL